MKSGVTLFLCAMLLAGCSWRALNPLNWFGGGDRAAVAAEDVVVEDRSILIDQIVAARAERTPEGVIVQSTGLAATQGAHGADLRVVYGGDGRFSHLEFRAIQPENDVIGSQASRVIVAVGYFTRAEAAALGSVTLRGARNAVTVSLH